MATWRTCKFCYNTAGISHKCKCGNDRYWYSKPGPRKQPEEYKTKGVYDK